jgi:hypothetical protein
MDLKKNRNPTLAAILSLVFGPIGFAYIGTNYLISGMIYTILLNLVLAFINIPYPDFIIWIQFLFYAYYGYKYCNLRNSLIEQNNSSDFGFTFFFIGIEFIDLTKYYSYVLSGYTIYFNFTQGMFSKGILVTIGIYVVSKVSLFILSRISMLFVK